MKPNSALRLLSIVILVLISSLLVSAAPAGQTAPAHVIMAATAGTSVVPVYIAIENGYFKEEGIDFELIEVNSGPLGEAAVISGQAQLTNDIDVDDVVNLQKEGKDPILVYNMVNSLTMDLVVRNDALEKAGVTPDSPLADREKALKGLTLGITAPGGSTDMYTRWLMTQAGLDPDIDAHIIALGSPAARYSALEAGQIDGFLGTPPQTFTAEQNGFAKILINNTQGDGDVPQFKEFAFSAISTSKMWAEANPQALEAFSRGMDRANAYLLQHTDEAINLLHQKYYPDTPLDSLKVSLLVTLHAITPEGKLSAEAIQNQADIMLSVGAIDAIPDTSEGVLWSNQWNPDTLTDLVLPTVEPLPAAEATAAS